MSHERTRLKIPQLSDVPVSVRAELAEFSPTMQLLLWQAGFDDKKAVASFINPSYEDSLHDPLLLHDIGKATKAIVRAVDHRQKIAIFSDYDCDGIPGAVVLHDFFTAIKHENFINYIPHRHYEGFGLSIAAVEKLAKDGVELIITIDCGVTDVEAVARANELGVAVIITDHHEPGETLPDALAIVNPKLGKYPFPNLCGAAVAFKLAKAVMQVSSYQVTPGQEKWWLDMVGLATIADMVPLVDENRTLALYGLKVLQKSRRPGLQHLLRLAKTSQRFITEDDIGFTVGPRINAASRMDAPEQALNLLINQDEVEAGVLARDLEKLNNERKGSVAALTRQLHQKVYGLVEVPPVLVFGDNTWRPSLVGLVAGKLAEEYQRPAFIWGRDGNNVIKGSARSGGGVSVLALMQQVPEAFLGFGGHQEAGGFSVADEQVIALADSLVAAHGRLAGAEERVEITSQTWDIKAELEWSDLFTQLPQELFQLAPFGVGNEKPLFVFRPEAPSAVVSFGKQQEHTRLTFVTPKGAIEAIAFFTTPDQFRVTPTVGVANTVLGYLEVSYWRGRREVRVRLVEILP